MEDFSELTEKKLFIDGQLGQSPPHILSRGRKRDRSSAPASDDVGGE